MNVLSLFDGMSCGRVALERARIKVDNYYSSEIDKYAIQANTYQKQVNKVDLNNEKVTTTEETNKIALNIEQNKLNEVIEEFYKQKASEKITKLVNKYSDIMKLFPVKLYFKSSKTKWASCSASNKISFNPEVMKLSSSLIKYVVIHELAHIQYKNHSKDFWNLIKKYMNDYQKKEEILRGFEKKV